MRSETGVSGDHVVRVLVVSGRLRELVAQWRPIDWLCRLRDWVAELIRLAHHNSVTASNVAVVVLTL